MSRTAHGWLSAGRTEPPLRIARLRAEGRILEIGPDELSLTGEEAASLLRNADLALGDAEVAELHGGPRGGRSGSTSRRST